MQIINAKLYGESLSDIEIKEGKITRISKASKQRVLCEEVFDAKAMTLLPSFVDLCVNLKNDKFSLKHLDLLEEECLKSGISSIVLRDVMDFDEESFSLFLQNLKQRKLKIFTSIKVVDKNNKLKNLATLINKGAFALELQSNFNANTLKASMQYALMKNAPVFVQCYDEDFDDKGVMNDSITSFELGLSGMSEIAETSEVAKIKELGKFYQTKLVFDKLSLKSSLNLLDKELKLVSIHHLIKDDSACKGFNSAAKLMPPLRSKQDVLFLKNALKKNKINFLSSLHSPKSLNLKDQAFDEAAFGIDSLSEYISLCWTFLVRNNFLSWKELCNFTSLRACEFLGLESGILSVGKEANFVLFDEKAKAKSKENSLYANDELFGVIKAHFIKGQRVF